MSREADCGACSFAASESGFFSRPPFLPEHDRPDEVDLERLREEMMFIHTHVTEREALDD